MSKFIRGILGMCVALGCLVAFSQVVRAEEGLWQTDFEAAKAKAKAEKKLLLVDFTGSDWCIWCKKLKAEVFEKDEFQSEVPKQFVLVELDYPRTKELPEEVKEQNKKLQKQYKIHGFPTVLVMDAEGQVIAHTGYQAGGPEKYVKHLGEFADVYASVVKMKKDLASAKGLDRAKLLDQMVDAYEKLNNESDEAIGWSKEIVSLDADNKAGLRVKHEFRMLLAESNKAKEEHKIDDAKAAIEKALALKGIAPKQQQAAYMAEGELCFMQHDFAGIVKCLEKAVDVNPDGPEAAQAKAMIQRFKSMADAQEAVVKMKDELEKSEGLDRAKLLDKLVTAQTKLLAMMPTPEGVQDIQKWTKEIISLDSDNKAGLKTKYEFRQKMAAAARQLSNQNFEKAKTTLDEIAALPGLTDEQKTAVENARKRLPKEEKDDKEKDASSKSSEK